MILSMALQTASPPRGRGDASALQTSNQAAWTECPAVRSPGDSPYQPQQQRQQTHLTRPQSMALQSSGDTSQAAGCGVLTSASQLELPHLVATVRQAASPQSPGLPLAVHRPQLFVAPRPSKAVIGFANPPSGPLPPGAEGRCATLGRRPRAGQTEGYGLPTSLSQLLYSHESALPAASPLPSGIVCPQPPPSTLLSRSPSLSPRGQGPPEKNTTDRRHGSHSCLTRDAGDSPTGSDEGRSREASLRLCQSAYRFDNLRSRNRLCGSRAEN
ncbi:unnamed protein product, partial [Protopolystoma xenopodis]